MIIRNTVIVLLLHFTHLTFYFLGLHESISINTMLVGHTKFAPDWHFGVWKVKWRASDAETMQDIATTVRASSRSGHNIPHLVSDTESPVKFFDWRSHLEASFRNIKNITKYHHFFVSKDEPGVLHCKKYADSTEECFDLLKCAINKNAMPPLKTIPVLPLARQWYLYDHISKFFRSESAKDKTCHKPLISK